MHILTINLSQTVEICFILIKKYCKTYTILTKYLAKNLLYTQKHTYLTPIYLEHVDISIIEIYSS
jgi:hypothetical protein